MSDANRFPGPGNLKIQPWMIILGVVGLLLAYSAFDSFFIVDQTQRGVVLTLGKISRVADPGLNWKLPYFEEEFLVPITTQKEEFGFRTRSSGVNTIYDQRDYSYESVMLTGDLNIIDIRWNIQYRIIDAERWLFSLTNVDPANPFEGTDFRVKTIRDVSQSVINRLVGDRAILDILDAERQNIMLLGQQEMNRILGFYDMGVLIESVNLTSVLPPAGRVQTAFEDLNVATQDRERLVNEGKEQYNNEIPRIRGEAERIITEAEGYATERVNRANGDVARFNAVYEEYRQNPSVTRTRLYFEMVEEALVDKEDINLIDRNLESFLPIQNLGGQQ